MCQEYFSQNGEIVMEICVQASEKGFWVGTLF